MLLMSKNHTEDGLISCVHFFQNTKEKKKKRKMLYAFCLSCIYCAYQIMWILNVPSSIAFSIANTGVFVLLYCCNLAHEVFILLSGIVLITMY